MTSNAIIRPLETSEDFRSFEALQRETWGQELAEVVTASMVKIVSRIGGLAAGAFDESGRMLGCVFGLTGFVSGRPIHWSHMLAVRKDHRDSGIGRRLKLYQREALLSIGIHEVYWTYDPLVAKNAHLNFNSLGAEVTEYAPDMYGPGEDSVLFRGLGTDRFIVVWRIAGDRVRSALSGKGIFDADAFHHSALVVGRRSEGDANSAPQRTAFTHEQNIRIEIPPDIHGLRDVSPGAAAQWRKSTRAAFQHYLTNGYEVSGFYREVNGARCFYCLREVRTRKIGTQMAQEKT